MELDRPHFRNTSTTASELLICFSTSRLSSSSSMKLTKSILSPGRAARDGGGGPLSLSSSLSRRLRTNGSIKSGHGQASPFFSTSKKRGPGFENPEPSSPKVTCIGQVRVKTKKRVKQNRSLSRRRSGEVSFRKIDQNQTDGVHYHQHQQRTHFSICEALSSCLFPCKSSCYSTERGKVDKDDENGCGGVFTRWLVSYNDEEGGKRREIELVVGGGDENEEIEEDERRVSMRRSSRRHVFEDIVVKDDIIEVKGQGCHNEEVAPRMSICIPPKNALLLMRCRSDPMKVAALANRFSFDPSIEKVENVCDDDETSKIEIFGGGIGVLDDNVDVAVECVNEEVQEIPVDVEDEKFHEEKLVMDEEMVEEKDEVESNMSSFEDLLDIQENADQHYEDCPIENNEEELPEGAICNLSPSSESEKEEIECNSEVFSVPEVEASPMEKLVEEDEENQVELDPEKTRQESAAEKEVEDPITVNQELILVDENSKSSNKVKEKSESVLPDCLLLMMCEPKLSMEVSKETWVCSTDFVRWLPERPPKLPPTTEAVVKPTKAENEPPVKRRMSTDKPPRHSVDKNVVGPPLQPRRSSCSLPPAAASMASMIEQKFVNAVAYEPFVLTRCKSEPMRTAASKLMPESFYWKNAIRKLEPHRRATVGISAAGVGC